MKDIKHDQENTICLVDLQRWLATLNALSAGMFDLHAESMAVVIRELMDELEAIVMDATVKEESE